MASREQWCSDESTKLLQEDLRVSTLNEIRDHLMGLPDEEVATAAGLLNLALVFDCLNDSNSEQIEAACEVLWLCLSRLEIGESMKRYEAPLERALNHPDSIVKSMALQEIGRNVPKEETLLGICKRLSLFQSILRCVGDEDIAVAAKALDIAKAVGLSSCGIKVLFSPDSLKVLREVMAINEVVRLRAYELMVSVAKESENNFNVIVSKGLLSPILAELDNDDVLLKMNVVELLTRLGLSKHGFDYLERNGIFTKLFSFIDNNNDVLTLQLCEPGILKFFGHMGILKPTELLSKYPKVFDRIFSNLENLDMTVTGVSLDTLAVIGLSNEGKTALDSTGNKIIDAIKTVVRLLPDYPMEVRLKALNCLENLLKVEDKKQEVMQITKKWFESSCEDPMEVVVKYAKNPFAEVKLTGLGILCAMAEQPWGIDEIKNKSGLVEFLLDRSVEVVKDCKEVKYEIVRTLANSTSFDQDTLNKLQQYVKEGPYYVPTITDIAYEGE